MKLLPPIFIIGSARAGKTLLGNFLSLHEDTCWFSNYTDRFVKYPIFSVIIKLRDMPYIGNKIKKSIVGPNSSRFAPRPVEGGRIYHSYCKLEHSKWATEDDLTKYQLCSLKMTIAKHVKFSGRQRFINDQSANIQRIRQIVAIFPDAYFIHIIRDGRAVANEILRMNWWPNIDIWWFRNKPHVWEQSGGEPVVLCGLHWKHDLEAVFNNAHLFKDRYLELRYEDLTDHPHEIVRKVFEFCDLDWNNGISRFIPDKLKNRNYRWKQQLTKKQIEKLNGELEVFLNELGYI